MNIIEFIGCFLIIIMAFISNAAGTAGGGVVIPLIMMFFGWGTKDGIAISNFTVVFTALTRFILEYSKRNEVKGYGTLINYDYIVLTIPPLKIGSALGAIVNQVLPEALIVIVLVLLLIFMFQMTVRKALQLFKLETAKKNSVKGRRVTQSSFDEDSKKRLNMAAEYMSDQSSFDHQNTFETMELQKIKEYESTHWQWPKLICTWVMMAQLFTISIIRGNGDSTDGGLRRCSPVDWVLFSLLIVNAIIMEVVAIILIKR